MPNSFFSIVILTTLPSLSEDNTVHFFLGNDDRILIATMPYSCTSLIKCTNVQVSTNHNAMHPFEYPDTKYEPSLDISIAVISRDICCVKYACSLSGRLNVFISFCNLHEYTRTIPMELPVIK